jgi:PIN domain nuclease of toxin-antitoxin system
VIVLDTHIWVWWANQSPQLTAAHQSAIQGQASTGLGVCAISLWEVAKLTEKGRLQLALPLGDWLAAALALPGVSLLPLTPEIAAESVQLLPPLTGDPADQLIVATARIWQAPLLTADHRLIAYAGVNTI